MKELRRLFISNIPDASTEPDIRDRISRYGNVVSVDIKERKNPVDDQTSYFGYFNVQVDDNNLQKCLYEFSKKSYRGLYLNVQLAKESFMERLKREREESKLISNKSETIVPTTIPETAARVPEIVRLPVNPDVVKKKLNSSSSECSDSDENQNESKNSFTPKKIQLSKQDSFQNGVIDGFVIKNNKSRFETNGLIPKIESVGKAIYLMPEKPAASVVLDPKQIVADKKRLQSLMEMKKEYRHQKSLIQASLSNIDVRAKNKIVFAENLDPQNTRLNFNAYKNDETDFYKLKQNNHSPNKLHLFENDDDDNEQDEISFEVKKQFEGDKGQELMKLQSRFKNDKRFMLDERFLPEEEQPKVVDKNYRDHSQKDEIHEQYDILEEVIGRRVRPFEKRVEKFMVRFDPSQPDHAKYEIEKEVPKEKKKRKRKYSEEAHKKSEETQKPEVSKEKFYEVADNLKESLKEKEGFSLLSLFGKPSEKEGDQAEAQAPEEMITIPTKKKTKFDLESNPFKYDSSDSEGEEVQDKTDKVEGEKFTVGLEPAKPARLWMESFFFKEDDYRLQEGMDFVKRLEGEENADFSKVRRELKEIARAKVKNNQSKIRPFKKKLGGKKRIKVKRALKR